MSLDVASILAARMPPVPMTAPLRTRDPLELAEAQYATEPTATKFTGFPSATIWIGGKKTNRKFSTNGIYITSNELEKAELRKTYGVREIKRILPMSQEGA